jgi:hypothetical protein
VIPDVLPAKDDRRRRALDGPVIDGLDVVAIGVESERTLNYVIQGRS